jgi:tetratricopeptide (TPR) repeat protein
LKQKYAFLLVMIAMLSIAGCTTTKRKGDVSKGGKVYHNTTALYNGYFNANELYQKSMVTLLDQHQDSYTRLLSLYPYRDVKDASAVIPDLNIAIEKVSRVINMHRVSDWTDDAYLLIGKSQYLKQDFETAEKTLEYFVNEMHPVKLTVQKAKDASKDGKKSKSKKSSKKSTSKSSAKKSNTQNNATAVAGTIDSKFAYAEGLIWMAKTYIERERWPSAMYMISKLESENSDPDLTPDIQVVKAYYFIKNKNFREAVAPLTKAIETADKKDKARYAYILAQIHESLGQSAEAGKMYSFAYENTKDYNLEFNARLNAFKNSSSTAHSSQDVLKELDKMLREEKFAEYKDQIYYTKAEIYAKTGDIEESEKYYRLSLSHNTSNTDLKTEIYHLLANRYFEKESYLEAKNYFDSTLMFMHKTDERFALTSKYANNLRLIATNLETIQLQDSLIALSFKSREEQEAIAIKIKEEREKNRKLQQAVENKSPVTMAGDQGIDRTNAGRDLSTMSSFFAYNQNSVRIGKMDFERKWEFRALEDDWRRSAKSSGRSNDEDEEQVTQSEKLTDAEFRTFMKDVPNTEQALTAAQNQIQKAMLNLGILYKDNLENHKLSAEILERLVSKYPDFEDNCKAMYYIYLAYNNMSQKDNAQQVVNRMASNYPDCSFTLALTKEGYLAEQMKKLNTKENLYQEVFTLYKAENYKAAHKRIQDNKSQFETDPGYAVKFDFIEAVCVGNIDGKEAYIKSMENLIARYPNTPEEIKAKEMLRFLKGDRQAFDPIIYKEGVEAFDLEGDKMHYIFVVLYNVDQNQLNEAKKEISSYNSKFYKQDGLRISNIYLDTNESVQIILIRKFDDKDRSMKYYYELETRSEEFLNKSFNFEVFSISQKNYREVIKQRSVNAYREYFAKTYLEKE